MSGSHLPEQNEALGIYLEGLLRAAEPADDEAAPVAEQPAPVKLPLPPFAPEPLAEPPPAAAAPETVPLPAEQAPPAPPESEAWPPVWGRSRFPCLIFSVAGLRLAVPLAKLNGVMPSPESLHNLPGTSPWLMGLTRYRETNVRVADTAAIVLPEERLQARSAASEMPSHLVIIGEGSWALACDAVSETLHLEPDNVRWRTARSKRPWLAGTVRDKLCALLDVDALAQHLDAAAGLD